MGRMPAITALVALGLGACLSLPASAYLEPRVVHSQGGPACQLSIPTTDTKVRAKAIGFRNEGTTAAFVICAVPTPDKFTDFNIDFLTIDGINHVVTCTALNGGAWDATYVSKSVNTGTSAYTAVQLTWASEDFGGPPDANLPSGYMSVTCNLPAQTSVQNVYIEYWEQVGN